MPVTSLEIVWCARRSHRLAGQSAVTPAQLEGEPLVLFQTGFSLRELVAAAFETAGVTPRVLHTSEQLSTVESLIRSGTASGFLLRPLAGSDPSMAAVPLTPPIRVQVSLVWRRSRRPFRDMARLMDLCRTAQLF